MSRELLIIVFWVCSLLYQLKLIWEFKDLISKLRSRLNPEDDPGDEDIVIPPPRPPSSFKIVSRIDGR